MTCTNITQTNDIIFTDKFITTQEYNISGVANPSSRTLSNFFSHYFKDYAINKLSKGSDFDYWVFVAHKDNKIIGAIKGEIFWQTIHIDLLIILPECRKMGIGTKLYDLAINLAKEKNCTMATVETFDFQAPIYWESKGFNVDFKREGYGKNTLYYFSKKI